MYKGMVGATLAVAALVLASWSGLLAADSNGPPTTEAAAAAALPSITRVADPAPIDPASIDPANEPDTSALLQIVRDRLDGDLVFERNDGQYHPDVRFLGRAATYTLVLTDHGIEVQWADEALRLRFATASTPTGEGLRSSTASHFIGNDPTQWRTDVPHYGAVRYTLAPGVEVLVHSQGGLLQFDHILAPGADPAQAGFTVEGAYAELQADGTLALSTQESRLVLAAPVLYQQDDEVPRAVAGGFRIDGSHVGYWVGPYDTSRTLVIDPILRHHTFLGGTGNDYARSIAVRNGPGSIRYVYVGGEVTTTAPPAGFTMFTHGGATGAGGGDAFVAKMQYDYVTRSLTPMWYAIVGSTGYEQGMAMAVDPSGHAIVVGHTSSDTFPIVSPIQDISDNRGWFDGSLRSGRFSFTDIFVAKIHNDGNVLMFSTYLGGGGGDLPHGVATDSAGNIVLTGEAMWNYFYSNEIPFPTKNPAQPLHGNNLATSLYQDAFITKIVLATSPPTFGFSTYLGGTGNEYGYAVAVDASNNVYATGYATTATGFPTSPGAFVTTGSSGAAFVSKYTSAGARVYTALLDGTGVDYGDGIAVDSSSRAWVAGRTSATNFPVCGTAPSAPCSLTPVQGTLAGGTDGYLVALNAAGSGLYYGTYLGGRTPSVGSTSTTSYDEAKAVAIDPFTGHVTVVGRTQSIDFPTSGLQPATHPSKLATTTNYDAFVTRVDPTSTSPLVFSTYLGGTGNQWGLGVAIDDRSVTYVAGYTTTGLTTLVPLQPTHGGSTYDSEVAIFGKRAPIAKIETSAPMLPATLSPPATSVSVPTWTNVVVTSAPSIAGDAPMGTRTWQLLDGATVVATGTGTVPAFSPVNMTVPGTRRACVTITDTDTRAPVVDNSDTACVDIQFTNRAPRAKFSEAPNPVSVGASMLFTDASTDLDGTIVSRSWTFGDGGTSTAINPTKVYTGPGTYTVTLTVTDDKGATNSTTRTVTVLDIPTAFFTYSGTMFAGAPVTFTDGSLAGSSPIATWKWEFGDGTSTTRTTPASVARTYAVGTYTVNLTVDDGTFQDKYSRVITILPLVPQGYADAYYVVQDGTLTVPAPGVLDNDRDPDGSGIQAELVTSTSRGSLTLNADGSFVYRPTIGYTGTDSFQYRPFGAGYGAATTVMLTVTPFVPPTADFEPIMAANAGTFVDRSVPGDHPIVSWAWDFGDGNTATTASPVHFFAVPGHRVVSLRVTDAYGLSSDTRRLIFVGAGPSTPLVGSDAPTVAGEPDHVVGSGASVVLHATSSAPGATFRWLQIGGPEVSLRGADTATPSFAAPQGPATLVFRVYAHDGVQTSLADHVRIHVRGANQPPLAHVAVVLQTVAYGETVQLDGRGSSDPDGDSLTAAWIQVAGPAVELADPTAIQTSFLAPRETANMVFRLEVADGVQSDATSTEVRVVEAKDGPRARFSVEPLADGSYRFQDHSVGQELIRTWDFGDGSANSHAANPMHGFVAPGSYVVRLHVQGTGGTDEFGVLVRADAVEQSAGSGDAVRVPDPFAPQPAAQPDANEGASVQTPLAPWVVALALVGALAVTMRMDRARRR
jgi:PKD repeat protein